MRNTALRKSLLLTTISASAILAGCSKAPDCADQETAALVQKFFWDHFEKVTTQFAEENPHLKPFHSLENAKRTISLQISHITQDPNKNDQGDFLCKATITTSPPSSKLYESVKKGWMGDVVIKMISAHYDMPEVKNRKAPSLFGVSDEESAKRIHAKQDKDALDFVTMFANGTDEQRQKLESMPIALLMPTLTMPLAGAVSPKYLESIVNSAELTKVDDPSKPTHAGTITFSSGVRKVDGKNRHYIEADVRSPLNFAVNAYWASMVYNLGDAKLQNLKKSEDDFRTKVVGTWNGKYSCEGLDGASSGAQGPFSMDVVAEVKQVDKSFNKYLIELNRTTLTGGVEKLNGEFLSKEHENWKLAGTGRNSIDDTWQAAYDMKLADKVIEGTGRTFTDKGETLRQCKINLAKN